MSKIEGWSLLEVDMDEQHRTFKVTRRLERHDIHNPNVKPSFVFITDHGAQLMVNTHGTFLIRFKRPKGFKAIRPRLKMIMDVEPLKPRLYKPPTHLKRLAKKAMRQLFASGKITIE